MSDEPADRREIVRNLAASTAVTVELRGPRGASRTVNVPEQAAGRRWLNSSDLAVQDDGRRAMVITNHYEQVGPGVYEWRSSDVDYSDGYSGGHS
jgi:hypothetical protein